MPRYDFQCSNCPNVEERIVQLKDFDVDQLCTTCGWPMQRKFPLEVNISVFQPQYDEALDVTFTSAMQKKRYLKQHGLVEAGDPVKGARNFDSRAPHHVAPQAPRWDKTEDAQLKMQALGREHRDTQPIGIMQGGVARTLMPHERKPLARSGKTIADAAREHLKDK